MIATLHSPRSRIFGGLGAALFLATLAACSEAAPSATTPAGSGSSSMSLEEPTSEPLPSATPFDLAAIVIPPESPPSGMTLSDYGKGPAVLEQLPLFPDTAAELLAAPGFIDGRWSRFAGSAEDFAASRGFILTWVVQYAAPHEARSVASILLNELQSDDRYGWGIGEDAGLGDEGTCLTGENPQMGGLHETIGVWRQDRLVMVVGGGSENGVPIETEAEAMQARAVTVTR